MGSFLHVRPDRKMQVPLAGPPSHTGMPRGVAWIVVVWERTTKKLQQVVELRRLVYLNQPVRKRVKARKMPRTVRKQTKYGLCSILEQAVPHPIVGWLL